jgi:hypothetical protein
MKIKYVNQKNEIYNGQNYCGSAVVAMITMEPPQMVANLIGPSAPDDDLLSYLKGRGFKLTKISDGGTANTKWGYVPADKDFDAIKSALDNDEVVLYHFAGWDNKSSGHYALVVGYKDDGFLFNDPAGDRKLGYFGLSNEGERTFYDRDMLKLAGIKRLFSIKETRRNISV